jgi:hypothetical protein
MTTTEDAFMTSIDQHDSSDTPIILLLFSVDIIRVSSDTLVNQVRVAQCQVV